MKVAKLFVIGILAFPLVLTQLQKIDATLPECEITKNSLFCDFKESDRDNVYLEPVNETIDKIYINNLRNVQLSSALCTNMALVNVGNVTLVNEGGLPCKQGFDLAAKDTIFDRMPVQINKIYLENCNVSSLITGATLTKLTVIQSFINSLDISYPLTNNTSFTFKESSIGVLKNLVIDGWPEFIMKDTTLSYIPPEGLIVKHGVLSVKDSSFINTTKDSIIIYPNATLDLENCSGNFKFSNMLIPTNKQVFSGAEESETDFFYPYIICLSLLIAIVLVCLIILSIWYYKKKGELCYQHVSKDPSDAKEIANEESGKLLQDERFTCHVKSDLCGGDVGEGKKKNTTQTSYNTDDDSQVNESKGNEMSSKIKEDTVSSGKRKSIFNENEFSKEGKNHKEKASHPDSSDRHNLKKTNDSPITSVPESIKRTVEDAKAGDDEDKDIDQTLSPAKPPPPKDMLPEPEDMITDNVILFRFYSLTQKEKSDIPYAISTERVKVGLRKKTYIWNEVFNEILSRNPSLSSLQVIELKGTDFGSIRNGDHLSKMNKTIIKTIKDSNQTGASSLPPGQEGTKGYGTEAKAKPDKNHITEEVGNISTSEHTEQFEKNKNGSNGSNLVRGVAKGSNSFSENSSARNRGTEEDMISGLNQNKSMFNVDQQDSASPKNGNGALYRAEPRPDGSSPSTSQEETKEDRPQEEHMKEQIIAGGDENDSNIHHSGPLATEDKRSAVDDPLSGGTSGRKSLGDNSREGSPSQTRGRTEQDSSGFVLPLSKLTEVEQEQENTITDNVVLFRDNVLKTIYIEEIPNAIVRGEVKVALKKDKYKWDRVNHDIYKYSKTFPNLPLYVIHPLDFKKIENGDSFCQIDLHHTNKTPNPRPDGSSPSTSQEESKENRLQGEPTKEHITAGGDGNGSNIQQSGSPATKDRRSAEGDPSSGGTSGRKSFGENTRDGNHSHTRRKTEKDSSGSVSHRSKPPEVEPKQENTITDNVVLFIHKPLYGSLENDIPYAIEMGFVKVALKKDEYKWDRVNQDIYKYRKTLPNFPLIVIHHIDFKKIKNGDPYRQIDFHYTKKASNQRENPSAPWK